MKKQLYSLFIILTILLEMIVPVSALDTEFGTNTIRLAAYEDFENYTASHETYQIVESGSVDNSKYLEELVKTGATGEKISLNGSGAGRIIIQYNAKSSGWYLFELFDDKNTRLVKYFHEDGRYISDDAWGYHRIIIDPTAKTTTHYYSTTSFADMKVIDTTVTLSWGKATSASKIGFGVGKFDNLMIFEEASGKNYKDGYISPFMLENENISINPDPFDVYFMEAAEAGFMENADFYIKNTKKGTRLEVSADCLSQTGTMGVKLTYSGTLSNNTEYELCIDNLTNSDGSVTRNIRIPFITEPYIPEVTLKINSCELINSEEQKVNTVKGYTGEFSARAEIENATTEDIDFDMVTCLYRRYNDVEVMEDYVVNSFSLNAGQADTFTSDSLTISDENDNYSLRVFYVNKGNEGYLSYIKHSGFDTVEVKDGESSVSQFNARTGELSIADDFSYGAGRLVTYLVKNSDDELLYIGEAVTDEDGCFKKAIYFKECIENAELKLEAYCEEEKYQDTLTVDTTGCEAFATYTKVQGIAEKDKDIYADYELYNVTGKRETVSWQICEQIDGEYAQVKEGDKFNVTENDLGKYIKFVVTLDGTEVAESEPVMAKNYKESETVKVAYYEDFENNYQEYKALVIEEADGENNTRYVRDTVNTSALNDYIFFDEGKSATGKVIIQYRAKGIGYYLIELVDDNKRRLAWYRHNDGRYASSDRGWGYHRVVIDVEAKTTEHYYSPESFFDMQKIDLPNPAENCKWGTATKVSGIRFASGSFDDVMVLAVPESGEYVYNVSNGMVDVHFFTPMDEATFTSDNIFLSEKGQDSNACKIVKKGTYGYRVAADIDYLYEKEYTLKQSNGVKTADGTSVANTSFDFETGIEATYRGIKITSAELMLNGEVTDKVTAGEMSLKTVANSVSDEKQNVIYTLALFRSGIDTQYYVDSVTAEVEIEPGASNVETILPAITVPEGRDGEYTLKLYAGKKNAPFDLLCDVVAFGGTEAEGVENDNEVDRGYVNTIEKAEFDYEASKFIVVGNIHTGEGRRLSCVVEDSENTVVGISDTVSIGKNGSYKFGISVPPRVKSGVYKVLVYGERVDVKEKSFPVDVTKIIPEVLDIQINGKFVTGQKVTASNVYYHPLGKEKTEDVYAWYVADTADGRYTKIDGEETYEYTLPDNLETKYVKAGAKVSDGTNISAERFTKAFRVTPRPRASELDFNGTKTVNNKVYAAYKYYHADNIAQKESVITWYRAKKAGENVSPYGYGEYIELKPGMEGDYIWYTVEPKCDSEENNTGDIVESKAFVVGKANKKDNVGSGSGGGGSSSIRVEMTTPTAPKQDVTPSEVVGFKDISESWAKDIIQDLCNKGIINGISPDTFSPYTNITRANFAALLVRIGKLESREKPEFTDLSQDNPSYAEVAAAYEAGILLGHEGSIRPNDNVTREEAAVMCVRYLQRKNVAFTETAELEFVDSAAISEWAVENIKKAVSKGIFYGDNTNHFNPKKSITREESAAVISRLLDVPVDTKSENDYIGTGNEKISIAEGAGIITEVPKTGYITDTDFGRILVQLGGKKLSDTSNNRISLRFATEEFMKLLGYDVLFEIGIFNELNTLIDYAQKVDLLDDISVGDFERFLSAEEFVALLDNLFEARIYKIDKVIGNTFEFDEDEKFMYDRYGMIKVEGIITSTEKSALYGSDNVDENFICIDNTAYKTKVDCLQKLGYYVEAYVNEDDKEVLHINTDIKEDDVLLIDAEEIESISRNEIEYVANNKVKRIKVPDYIPVIVNGTFKGYLNALTEDDIYSERGYIELLDNNNDNKYDVLISRKYQILVVDKVNTSNNLITFKNRDESIYLEREGYDIKYSMVYLGKKAEISELQEWDALAVLETENAKGVKYYDINVIRRSVTGVVTGRDEEYIYIDRYAYKVLSDATDGTVIGKSYTFIIAGNDDIIAYEKSDGCLYGYLLSLKKDEMNDSVNVKYIDSKGGVVKQTLGEKIIYNDKNMKTEDFYELLAGDGSNYQQVIKYITEDGVLKRLYTVTHIHDDVSFGKSDEFFTASELITRREVSYTYNRLYNLATDAVVFFITAEQGELITEDDITVAKATGTSNRNMKCQFFDVNDVATAKAAVLYSNQLTTFPERSLSAKIVERIYEEYDKDLDEVVKYMSYYSSGTLYKTPIAENVERMSISGLYKSFDDSAVQSIDDLQCGDIIQATTNKDGEICNFRVLFDMDNQDYEYGDIVISNNEYNPYFRMIYTPVYAISNGMAVVQGPDGEKHTYNFYQSGTVKTYLYDRKNKTVTNSNFNSLITVQEAGNIENATKVVLGVQQGAPQILIMITD